MRALLIFFVSLLFGTGGMAMASEDLLDAGRRLLETAESRFDAQALEKARAFFDGLARSGTASPLAAYYRARISFALANLHAWRKETGEALRHLDEAIASAKTAVRLNPQHSDSHRLLGEAYGRLIGLKGGMTGLLYGRRAHNEIALALKLDPENPRASVAMGIWKLRTPKLFGGDPEEALRHFHRAIQIEPQSAPARVWLGVALKEQGRREEAREALEQAVALQPQNGWARGELELLGSSR